MLSREPRVLSREPRVLSREPRVLSRKPPVLSRVPRVLRAFKKGPQTIKGWEPLPRKVKIEKDENYYKNGSDMN